VEIKESIVRELGVRKMRDEKIAERRLWRHGDGVGLEEEREEEGEGPEKKSEQ
jgi:hypothetical protein